MKLDKRGVSRLAAMPDAKLYGTVKLFCKANGIDISARRVTDGEIANFRRMLNSLTDGDLERISELTSIMKYGR